MDVRNVNVDKLMNKARNEASSSITPLQESGIQTLMVTGDTEKTAYYIADKVGIKQVVANAKPEQKLEIIRQL